MVEAAAQGRTHRDRRRAPSRREDGGLIEPIALGTSVTFLLLLVPVALAAQSVNGTADWGYGRSTYRTGDEQTTNSSFMQGYTVGYRSSFWDPRLLTYAGELTFNRNALTYGQEEGASKQTGFKVTANLFPSRPFRGSIHGSRQIGGESANYPESSTVRSGLVLPAGSAPELRTERSEFGVNWQLTGQSMPRVELSYQEGSATIAAGSLDAVQQQRSLQAIVAKEGPRLSNTLRYQRNATDNGVAGYHPPPVGEIDLLYGTATLAHQANKGLSADMSVGFDREQSDAGG